jgi:hypothetical protein
MTYLRAQMPVWQRAVSPASRTITVAVMGCMRQRARARAQRADIGISLPGTGEAPAAPVFIDGDKARDPAWRRHRPASSTRSSESYIERRFGAAVRRCSHRHPLTRAPARRCDFGMMPCAPACAHGAMPAAKA